MAAFHYTCIDSNGKKQTGLLEAESAKHARQLLRNKNLMPISIHSASQKITLRIPTFFRKNYIDPRELASITRQFSTLLAAGMPIEEVLAAVAEQTEKPRSKGLMLAVRSKVLEGHSLAAALREFPNAFSELYCGTIAAGEKSGHLDIVLQRLADYTEQQLNIRQKIQQALIYPAIMVLVSFGIVGFLLEYVVPKMVTVYSTAGQSLPDMTRFLIAMSNGIQKDGIYLLILIVISIWLFRRQLKKSISFREKIHSLWLKLPIIGKAIKTVNTARFSRTFAILSAAGVSVLEAMTIASKIITNLPIRYAVEEAANRVREGASIHLALKQTHYFPAMSIHLLASGEASGQLETMLDRAATNQENDISRLIETSLALFEPMIILIMGAIVLFIVLAVLLPIFQLNQFT